MWYTPSLPLHSSPLSPGVVVPIMVPPIGQIELFNLILGIIISILKPYSCMQVVPIR